MIITFKLFKSEEKQIVFGWGSVAKTADGKQLVDKQGDMIDSDELETAAYKYVLEFRATGEEHIPTLRNKGRLIESCVFTEEKQEALGIPQGILPVGWWVGFKIDDKDTWERIKDGTYNMFSVEGEGIRTPVDNEIEKSFSENTSKTFSELFID